MLREREILFGELAHRLFRVPPDSIQAAAQKVEQAPDSVLGDLLVENGSLSHADYRMLAIVVEDIVATYDGDAKAALTSLGESWGSLSEAVDGAVGETLDTAASDSNTNADSADLVPEMPGRYAVRGEHAHGGIGRVLLVHDRMLGRDVALKELLPEYITGRAPTAPERPVQIASPAMRRFLQEARVTSQLEHPSIVPVYELGRRDDGTPYYTMRFVRGRTLAQAIAEAHDLRERLELLPHFLDLCQAVAYAHSRGVIHRDLKPMNVLVGSFGETVVIDWGLAKVRGASETKDSESVEWQALSLDDAGPVPATRMGQILGTPHYMAPEQALGRTPEVDEASDIYALGAVLYEVLTGNRPYHGSTSDEVLRRVAVDRPIPVRKRVPEVPAELAAICERAMAPGRTARYPDVTALIDEIQRFQSGALVQAHEYTFGERLTRFAARHRTPLALSAIAILLLAGLGTYYNVRLIQTNQSLEQSYAELSRENYVGKLSVVRQALDDSNYDRANAVLRECPPELRHFEWGLLKRGVSPAIWSYDPSYMPDEVYGMAAAGDISPDGRYVLSHHHFSGVKAVYDLQDDRFPFVRQISTGNGWRDTVRFLPDSQQFASPIDNHTVGVWVIESGEQTATFRESDGYEIVSFMPSHDGRFAATYGLHESGEGRITVWELPGGDPVQQFATARHEAPFPESSSNRYFNPVSGVLLGFLPDSSSLVFLDTHLAVLDWRTGEMTRLGPANYLGALATHAPVAAVLSPDNDSVTVWDLDSRTQRLTFETSLDPGGALSISGDGSRILVWSRNLHVYDARSGVEMDTIHMASNKPRISANGRAVITISGDRVHITDIEPRSAAKFSVPFKDEAGTVLTEDLLLDFGIPPAYAFDDVKSMLALGDDNGALRVYRVPENTLLQSWNAHDMKVLQIDFSPDGTRLATAAKDAVRVWDVSSGEMLMEAGPDGAPETLACAFSPDGKRIAIGGGDGSDGITKWKEQARVVDASTGALQYRVAGHSGSIRFVDFSPDGKWLITGGYGAVNVAGEASIKIWDAETGSQFAGQIDNMNWPWHAQYTPDGKHMLALGLSLEPVLYDLENRQEVYRLNGVRATQVIMHPDGSRFAVVTEGWSIQFFATEDGRLLLDAGSGSFPATFFNGGREFYCNQDGQHMQRWRAADWTLPDGEAEYQRQREAALELLQHPPLWEE